MSNPSLFELLLLKWIKARGVFLLFAFLLLCRNAYAATFTVTTTSDGGPGSFRQAILDATSGTDTIEFQILGVAPFTISPTSQLPQLNDPVVINATTQLGYISSPVVELDGTLAGASAVGLVVAGGNSTVRGLAINRFSADGIRLDSSSNVIQGNYIGTDVTGIIARGNGQIGVFVFGTSSNLIGGTTAADRNVISGGNETGIYILGGTANLVQGNYIGVSALGFGDLGNNNNGVTIFNASGNGIGGLTPAERNVIGGNNGSGINLNSAGATGNIIQGNYIGVGVTPGGITAVSNLADGITLNGAPGNLIGGTNSGARNLISGNGQAGIFLNGPGSTGNWIEGNYIGTDTDGLGSLGNGYAGVTLSGAISNSVGGTVAEARNLISGNRQDGVFVTANSVGNRIQGNFIGVNASGTGPLANSLAGVTLNDSSFNVVAGSAGAGSVISGNGDVGIWIQGVNANSNAIVGNLIGTAVGGTSALGNVRDGVRIRDGSANWIGGTASDERNIISGNGFMAGVGAGISVENTSASGNVIRGNFIGTDITGQAALANRSEGIYIIGAKSTIIGGESAGGGNLISGNNLRGIRITNSVLNEIRGNLIGTRVDGLSSLANGQFNVELEENSSSNSIGAVVTGAGNRIAYSGGGFAAVRVRDLSINNAILGNAIFSNSGLGIAFSGASVTANDNNNCDADTGGNLRQNTPLLTRAVSGVNTGVRGTLNSSANTIFRVQFFASPSCDPSGNGEGQIYLGDKLVTTDAGCSSSFVATLPVAVTTGYVITATATDPANNTSEFSGCVLVSTSPRLTITAVENNQVSLAWTNTATGFVLKETDSLSPPIQWTTVTNTPLNVGGQFIVTLAPQTGNRFYLLNFE